MTLLPFEYAVRNLGRSSSRLLLSVTGSALVVGLVLAAGSFVRGMDRSIRDTGGADNVILLGSGSEESVERSEVPAAVPGIVAATLAGVREVGGTPCASAEVHVQLPLSIDAGRAINPVMVRGVTPEAMLVHQQAQISAGRFPSAGADEVMVGRMVHARLGVERDTLGVGRSVTIDSRPWTIVGEFVAPGTVLEAEVWAPLTDIKQATRRETISCVVITLDPARSEFADVAAFVKMRPDLELAAIPETRYYASLAEFFAPIRAVVWITAGLVGLGGLFGGLNTMYAAFASRVRELGTLQSMGFRRSAIVVSLVQESLLAASGGAVAACIAGVTLLDGVAVRFSMGAFGLIVDPAVLSVGLGAGLVLGLVGALPPAWRSLMMEIPVALKAV